MSSLRASNSSLMDLARVRLATGLHLGQHGRLALVDELPQGVELVLDGPRLPPRERLMIRARHGKAVLQGALDVLQGPESPAAAGDVRLLQHLAFALLQGRHAPPELF